jgi:excisionase family DNA binding protein
VERATPAIDDPDRLLTVQDLAQQLKVKPTWVYFQVESGVLPFVRLGKRYVRFRQRDINAYLEAQRGAEAR